MEIMSSSQPRIEITQISQGARPASIRRPDRDHTVAL